MLCRSSSRVLDCPPCTGMSEFVRVFFAGPGHWQYGRVRACVHARTPYRHRQIEHSQTESHTSATEQTRPQKRTRSHRMRARLPRSCVSVRLVALGRRRPEQRYQLQGPFRARRGDGGGIPATECGGNGLRGAGAGSPASLTSRLPQRASCQAALCTFPRWKPFFFFMLRRSPECFWPPGFLPHWHAAP
jgi:hypothetical protein